jgi:hypothetical protein
MMNPIKYVNITVNNKFHRFTDYNNVGNLEI